MKEIKKHLSLNFRLKKNIKVKKEIDEKDMKFYLKIVSFKETF